MDAPKRAFSLIGNEYPFMGGDDNLYDFGDHHFLDEEDDITARVVRGDSMYLDGFAGCLQGYSLG